MEEKKEEMLDLPVMTFWEKLVWLRFNLSDDERVSLIKRHFADVIDLLDKERNKTEDWLSKRAFSIAITECQTAQMRAVKSLFS